MTVQEVETSCEVQTCDRKPYARGWCKAHYSRWRKHRQVQPEMPVRAYRPGTLCAVPQCKQAHSSLGLCRAHYHKSRAYNLTVEDLAALSPTCGICLEEFGEDLLPHIDHDHTTGEVRGALCNRCNAGIGMLADDPVRVLRAADWLMS